MTRGTPQSSQIIWLEQRVKELEEEVGALRPALEETRKIIVEVCGACSVPLPEATLERVDAALDRWRRLRELGEAA